MRFYSFSPLFMVIFSSDVIVGVESNQFDDSGSFSTPLVAGSTKFAANESATHPSLNRHGGYNANLSADNVNEERFSLKFWKFKAEKKSRVLHDLYQTLLKGGDVDNNLRKYVVQIKISRKMETMDGKSGLNEFYDDAVAVLTEIIPRQKLFSKLQKWQSMHDDLSHEADEFIASMLRKPADSRNAVSEPWPRPDSTPRGLYKELNINLGKYDRTIFVAWLQYFGLEYQRFQDASNNVAAKKVLYDVYDHLAQSMGGTDTKFWINELGSNLASFKKAMEDLMKQKNDLRSLAKKNVSIKDAFTILKAEKNEENLLRWLEYCQLIATRKKKNIVSTVSGEDPEIDKIYLDVIKTIEDAKLPGDREATINRLYDTPGLGDLPKNMQKIFREREQIEEVIPR
ncbi:hypothetical protein Plhal710r2_c064g0173201 [Plasmopara halstedii]